MSNIQSLFVFVFNIDILPLSSNFLNVELIGTKIITMEDFYKMKEEEFFLKSKLPLYLYSFKSSSLISFNSN
ncbi:hypothetical protein C3923_13880, partial [Staphylococcus aureus]